MEPVITPFVTDISLALCYFVGVVRESIVNAAAMDIKVLAEIFERDCRALDVPSGISHAPRAVPFQLLRIELRLCEPKHEISLVALVSVRLNALTDAHGEVFLFKIMEHIVFFKL